MAGPKQYYTVEEAVVALQRFCAMQERCHEEVRQNLIKHQVYGDELEEVIFELIQEDFLNEERFAEAFVRGKFRMKKWGRLKIMQALKFKKISSYCIERGMQEIDEEDYLATLESLLSKKYDSLRSRGLDEFDILKKMSSYAISKGYEQYLVFGEAKKIVFGEK